MSDITAVEIEQIRLHSSVLLYSETQQLKGI